MSKTAKQLRNVYYSFLSLLSTLSTYRFSKSIHFLSGLADKLIILYDHVDTLHQILQDILSVLLFFAEFKLNNILKRLTIYYCRMNTVDSPFANPHAGPLIVTSVTILISMSFIMMYFKKKTMDLKHQKD